MNKMFTCSRNNLLKQIIVLVLLACISVSLSSCGVKAQKEYRVGILSGLDYLYDATESFKSKMSELGYVEGENITYIIKKTNSDFTDYENFSKQFVEDKVDLIFCYPTEAALELKEATKGTNIPVVFGVTNIEDTNLVNSVREPGGNVTGVRYPGPDLALKRFDVIRQIVPEAKRILLPYSSDYPVCYPQLEALRPVAEKAGITLVEAPLKTAEDLVAYFDSHDVEGDIGFDAILSIAELFGAMPDTFLVMVKFANKHDIPFGGAYMNFEGYASLFGVNINPSVTGQKAAVLADKILSGEDPATVSVVSDESFIQIDYKEAQKRGYSISDELLSQASEIIK
jgi:putative ABC transport system substrate-binding protein